MGNVRPQNRAYVEELIGKHRLGAIVEDAIAKIGPKPADRARCRESIEACIEILPCFLSLRDQPTPGQERKNLRKLRNALDRTRIAIDQLSDNMAYSITDGRKDDFLAMTARARLKADVTAEGLVVSRRGQRRDPVMVQAAVEAYRLLEKFSDEPPTTTPGRPFFELTQLLHETVTGCADANVERACDFVHKHNGDVVGKTGDEVYVRLKWAGRS